MQFEMEMDALDNKLNEVFDGALLQKSDDEGFTSRIHGVRRGA